MRIITESNKKLYLIGGETSLPPKANKVINGKNWIVIFKDLRVNDKELGHQWGTFEVSSSGKPRAYKQILVCAEREENAHEAFELIYSALGLWDACLYINYLEICRFLPIDKEFKLSFNDWKEYIQVSNHRLYYAVQIAARASYRIKYRFCLARLYSSYNSFSVPFQDLNPSEGKCVYIPTLKSPHTAYGIICIANAITHAYQVIEELGLTPTIKETELSESELEKTLNIRLLKVSGINQNETFDWILRGQKRFSEKGRKSIKSKCKWAGGKEVRDEELTYTRAIMQARFLRTMTTHTLSFSDREDQPIKNRLKINKTLSACDVANVQYLARILLLRAMGYFKKEKIII